MDENDENVITYETFRKFQRQERESENLQKLPEDFFESCAEWIKRKGAVYRETNDPMVLKEIENVMSVIKDVLERRERKLLLMAMHVVRSDAVPQNLHAHEEKHFDSIVDHLKEMRDRILAVIKSEKPGKENTGELEKAFRKEIRKAEAGATKPLMKKPAEIKAAEKPKEKPAEKAEPLQVSQENFPRTKHEKNVQEPTQEPAREEKPREEPKPRHEKPKPEEKPEEVKKEKPKESEKPKSEEPGPEEKSPVPVETKPKIVDPPGSRILKVLEDVPKFLGADGKACGPFSRDDIVTVDEKVAEVLVGKGKAEFANI